MTISSGDFAALWVDLGIALLALLVILVDAVAPARVPRRVLGYVTFAGLTLLFGASFVWPPETTLAFFEKYASDPWSLYFKQVLIATTALSVLGSIDHVSRVTPRRQAEFYVLLQFSLLGMSILSGARDLILLVICFELASIPLFGLAALEKLELPGQRRSHPAEATLKFFLVGVVSTPLTLFGVSLVAGLAQSTELTELTRAEWTPLMKVGSLLVLAGMGFKIGMVPFHMWVPDTYQASATPFVAFLSTAPKVAGFAALSRIYLLGLSEWKERWVPTVVVLCVLTLVLGNFWALSQRNTKRLLAYSGIGHVGYLLMGLLTANEFGAGMLLFYLAAYCLTNVGAFLVVEAVTLSGGSETLSDFDGLARRAPWLGLAMLLLLLSLAGIPFAVGFWAKLYVFVAVWKVGLGWLVLLGALLAVVALFYYLQLVRAMYMVEPESHARLRVAPALGAAILLSLAGVVGFGVYPRALLERTANAASWGLGAHEKALDPHLLPLPQGSRSVRAIAGPRL